MRRCISLVIFIRFSALPWKNKHHFWQLHFAAHSALRHFSLLFYNSINFLNQRLGHYVSNFSDLIITTKLGFYITLLCSISFSWQPRVYEHNSVSYEWWTIKLSMTILKQYLSQIKQTNVDDSQQHSRG